MDDAVVRRRGSTGQRLQLWLPVIAWAALIATFSAQPDLRFVTDPRVDLVVRKAGHMGVFGILALLTWRAVANTSNRRQPWAWALFLTIQYAATDELHQGFVPGRSAAIADVAFDAGGAVSAVALVWLVQSWRVRRHPVPG